MPTFHATVKAHQAMVSTVGGQRRILKRGISVLDYIRKAVETGVYRTETELAKLRKDRRESSEDLRVIMRRFRQDIVRGSHIHDYPVEYLIHEQHPPLPDPPRIPAKLLRKMQPAPDPVGKLAKRYATKFSHHHGKGTSGPTTADDYYERLLGIQAAKARRNAGVVHKPAVVQRAYAAAIEHHELVRTKGLSDAEASQQVDELLRINDRREAEVSRMRAQAARNLRNQFEWSLEDLRTAKSEQEDEEEEQPEDPMMGLMQDREKEEVIPPERGENDQPFLDESLRSIFDANPAALEGMMRWSERLQAVPYKEWTIGAATALDHWIALRLLGMTEATWQSLLEGDMYDPALLAKGRDIVSVRESLFPETSLDDALKKHSDEPEAEIDEESSSDKKNPALDDLFDNLISDTKANSSVGSQSFDFLSTTKQTTTVDYSDETISDLVDELQAYRRKQWNEGPYEDWGDSEKIQFDGWLRRYVTTMSRGNMNRKVDMDKTRIALLSEPPVSKEESENFWGQIQDEGRAVALLDSMIKDGPPPGATLLQSSFWELPQVEQLNRLLNLGELRPLLDEYTKESDRLRFLQRYSDTLLEGVKLEHLISDPSGPIVAKELPDHVRVTLRVGDEERFRLERREYRSVDDLQALEKSRELFRAWNTHKAGRARYEEKLFRTNRLGLRYDEGSKDKPKKR